MKPKPKLLVPILLVLVAAACGGGAPPLNGPASFDGRHYELQITHRLEAQGELLSDDLWTEAAFSSVNDGELYRLSLSADERSCELRPFAGGETLMGHLEASLSAPADVSIDDSSRYFIDEGTFAGGRLVIWRSGLELRAEVTIYGSGLPVLVSERGDLVELVG